MGVYWLLHNLCTASPKRSRRPGATFETMRRVREGRRARRGAEGQDQSGVPSQLSSHDHAQRHDRRHRHARTSRRHALREPQSPTPSGFETSLQPPPSTRLPNLGFESCSTLQNGNRTGDIAGARELLTTSPRLTEPDDPKVPSHTTPPRSLLTPVWAQRRRCSRNHVGSDCSEVPT